MDNQQPNQPQLEEARRESLERAGALEQMTTTKGWEYVKAFIQNKIQTFANESIIKGYETLEEFNFHRGEVNGLRELIGEIDHSLQELHEYRKSKESTK